MAGLSGKYVAALTHASQETTLALASLNFDFALFKVEAPLEYHGVGQFLSQNRREAAENGNEHMTARRLGALFGQALPATPNLIRAYGIRCSEIAKSAATSPSTSRTKNLFRDWAGADATSIWAAATSGKGAIPVHLLACMLARLWTAPEATAIWEELIENRKTELASLDARDPLHVSSFTASRIDIKRDEISRWDASARAWLSVADGVKKKEQTQLMLLMRDLSLPISARDGVYSSVMLAWKTAMEAMENILKDTSQSLPDGAVLVGLASWHLYPNVYALEADTKTIGFKDSLIPTKVVVTLGAAKSSFGDGSSVHWSLPLAHMRYYGDPVPASRSMAVTSARLSMPECLCVALGAVFSTWESSAFDLDLACRVVVALSDYILVDDSHRAQENVAWLQHLSEAAQTFLASQGTLRSFYQSLIMRGQRRYARFLAAPEAHPKPMFGLSNVWNFIRVIREPDNKVAALRSIAKSLDRGSHTYLIRYRRPDTSDAYHQQARDSSPEAFTQFNDLFDEIMDHRDVLSSEPAASDNYFAPKRVVPAMTLRLKEKAGNKGMLWEFATAVQSEIVPLPKKRKRTPDVDLTGHVRWKIPHLTPFTGGEMRTPQAPQAGEEIRTLEGIAVPEHGENRFVWIEEMSTVDQELTGSTTSKTSYQQVLGNPDDAAIFRTLGHNDVPVSQDMVTPEVLLRALSCGWIDCSMLLEQLCILFDNVGRVGQGYLRSLQGLAAAASVYKLMPGATINPVIFTCPLSDSKWITKSTTEKRSGPSNHNNQRHDMSRNDQTSSSPFAFSREQTMACIAKFENVEIDLEPSSLKNVMALSCGNSIYVSAPLICDPSECPLDHEVKHIMGNIGRPGLSLMIPPIAPKVRKLDENVWTHINHHEFNGMFDDCYQHTSLHLTFTGYQLPVSGRNHGEHVIDAFFVESVVSVFDRSTWVADVDILGALAKSCLRRMHRPNTCRHPGSGRLQFPLTSIDSWEEYLDRPLMPAIFRCNQNWLARLAVVSLNASTGRQTILFPDRKAVCWQCVSQALKCIPEVELAPQRQSEKVPLFIC